MRDFNRARLQRVLARFERRTAAREDADDGTFTAQFLKIARHTIDPLMREVAAELEASGHSPEILWPEREGDRPCIELALGLKGSRGSRNVVGFCVIQRAGHPLEVQAYLEVNPPPFDLDRFAQLDELRSDVVERIVLEAVEHVVASNAP